MQADEPDLMASEIPLETVQLAFLKGPIVDQVVRGDEV